MSNIEPRRTRKNQNAAFTTVMQVVAILLLVGLMSTILHKAWVDVSGVARQHSGADFWATLARQLFRNLAGG